jgi:polyisoprenoid-binding protein YceI
MKYRGRAAARLLPFRQAFASFTYFARFAMSLPTCVRIISASAVALLVAAAISVPVVAQDAARAPLTLGTARVSIAGTSNVHAYTASTTTVRLTRVQVASAVSAGNFWEEIVKPGQLESFEIVIPAATLTSPKEGLDKNMHKALKVQEFPDITFRLVRTAAGTAGTLNAVGVLKIAGVEREVTLALKTERQDAGLLVTGELPLLMTDFGIKPPTAMLGMLKTDPKVTITFETVLGVPLT